MPQECCVCDRDGGPRPSWLAPENDVFPTATKYRHWELCPTSILVSTHQLADGDTGWHQLGYPGNKGWPPGAPSIPLEEDDGQAQKGQGTPSPREAVFAGSEQPGNDSSVCSPENQHASTPGHTGVRTCQTHGPCGLGPEHRTPVHSRYFWSHDFPSPGSWAESRSNKTSPRTTRRNKGFTEKLGEPAAL